MTKLAPDGTHYELTGPLGAPVLILIHGLGLNKDCWQWMIPAFNNSYQILSYDLYGHGGSPAPPAKPNLSLFCKQLVQLLDHCHIKKGTVIGFSLGGMIARRFAQDAQERIQALVILHSPHKRSETAQAAIIARVEQARELGPQSTVEAALERWFTESFRINNPELMNTVRVWVTKNQKEVYHTIYNVLATGITEIVAPTPALTCPALVITGEEDYGNGAEMAKAIAAEIPGAKSIILPGLRHMALAEAPETINNPIRVFLDDLETLK